LESGADSIVARNEHVMPLVKDLNLEDEMVYNETGNICKKYPFHYIPFHLLNLNLLQVA
jgi:protoporphyrinogen oxidase